MRHAATTRPDAGRQRLLTVLLVALLLATGVVTFGPSEARADTATGRLQGASRFDTAVAIALQAFPDGADRVYLARADTFPDALSAGALKDGPVLLVPRSGAVPAAVVAAVSRLSPSTVVALGGAGAVSDAVLTAAAQGREVGRLAGASRFATAVAISRAAFPSGARTVYLARADSFPDALAAGVLTDGPILLVPPTGAVPGQVSSEVRRLAPGRVVALGGQAAVSEAVLRTAAGTAATSRLAGADRYSTAARIAAAAFPDGAARVYLARGDAFPDALAAGALTDGPVVLTPSCGAVPAVVAAEIARTNAQTVIALGGPSAVCDALLAAAARGDRTIAGPAGVALVVPSDAFPAGVVPEVRARQGRDAFVDTFALSATQPVVSVTAAVQPAAPVQLVMPYDPAAAPTGATPSVFTYDEELALWLPVPTVVDAPNRRLVATVDHFTDFTSGWLRAVSGAVDTAANWVDWLAFQVADAVGGRAGTPACREPEPDWSLGLAPYVGDFPRNQPLLGCDGAAADASQVEVRAGLNRPYSLELALSQPAASVAFTPTVDLVDVAGQVIADRIGSASRSVLVPARAEVQLAFAQPADATSITMRGRVTPRSVLLDTVMSALEVGAVFGPDSLTARPEVLDCSLALLERLVEGTTTDQVVGAWVRLTETCLGPAAKASGSAALERLSTALSVGLLAGRAGQSLFDAGRAINEPHELVLRVLPATGGGAVDGLAGVWSGPVDQPGSRPYSVVLALHQQDGRFRGVVAYPELSCSGSWTEDRRESGVLYATERIDPPYGSCVSTVEATLRLIRVGEAAFTFRSPFGQGTLRPHPCQPDCLVGPTRVGADGRPLS